MSITQHLVSSEEREMYRCDDEPQHLTRIALVPVFLPSGLTVCQYSEHTPERMVLCQRPLSQIGACDGCGLPCCDLHLSPKRMSSWSSGDELVTCYLCPACVQLSLGALDCITRWRVRLNRAR